VPRSTATDHSKSNCSGCSPPVLGEVIRPLIKGAFTAWKLLSALVGSEYSVPSSNHYYADYYFLILMNQRVKVKMVYHPMLENSEIWAKKTCGNGPQVHKGYIKGGHAVIINKQY
jgi:hypothetical protein